MILVVRYFYFFPPNSFFNSHFTSFVKFMVIINVVLIASNNFYCNGNRVIGNLNMWSRQADSDGVNPGSWNGSLIDGMLNWRMGGNGIGLGAGLGWGGELQIWYSWRGCNQGLKSQGQVGFWTWGCVDSCRSFWPSVRPLGLGGNGSPK